MRAVNAAGIGWDVVRVWEDGGYDLEHMLKSLHNAPRLCPICQQQAVTEAMDEQVWVEEEEFWVGG